MPPLLGQLPDPPRLLGLRPAVDVAPTLPGAAALTGNTAVRPEPSEPPAHGGPDVLTSVERRAQNGESIALPAD